VRHTGREVGMSESRPSFWTTVPGILTGLAALITALVAAAALFLGTSGGTSDGGASGATAASGPGTATGAGDGDRSRPPTSAGSAGAVTTTAAAGGRTAETSEVVLRDGDYLDVDTGVQGNSVSNYDLVWSRVLSLDGVRNAIVPAETDQAGCMTALTTRSDDVLSPGQLSRGAVVCLTTDAGALVQARIFRPT
jgi:hypothetical protein